MFINHPHPKQVNIKTPRSDLLPIHACQPNTVVDRFRELARHDRTRDLVEYLNEALPADAFWRLVEIKAKRLRHIFRKLYDRELLPGECIALASTRSLDTLSDMIAILFAGGAFVPFNPRDPADRIQFILSDSLAKLRIIRGTAICNSSGTKFSLALASESATEKLPTPEPRQLAYIMYTSGSTGKPKGVQISHDALWHYLHWFESLEIMNHVCRVDLSINLTFDASITTSLVAIACGNVVSVCPEEIKDSPRAFVEYLSKKRIDLCKCTPSYFKLLAHEANQFGTNITHPIVWLLTGEEINTKDTASWLKIHPSHTFYNSYGPTEATVTCSKFRIDRHNIGQFSSGIPIAHRDRSAIFHILDEQMQPVPNGLRGELYLEGKVLADGYQNNPERTAQAFVRDSRGHLLYRTGDHVSSSADGIIYYHGRLDDQVKIRGMRIELGEIRNVLCTHPEVLNSKVIAHTVEDSTQLVAFVLPKNQEYQEDVLRDDIQKLLLSKLPAAMTPQKFIFLNEFTMNQAGKIDIQSLQEILKSYSFRREKMLVVNPLELSLLNIWRHSLSNKKIGTDSNFFDLGGNSLLALEVMDGINRHLDSAFQAHIMFQKPTIRELAQVITDNHKTTFLHHFRHRDNGPLLVLIHPASGLVMPYFCLANYLPALDFYGISSERFGDRKRCFANLEEMAQSYLKALDPLVGERPLILGGFCTGGAVAYEMAQQLKRSGKKINGLVLIDSYKIQSFGSQESRDAASSALLNNIGVDSDSILGKRITYEMEKNRRLVANYKPTPHDGPTLLVQCGKFDEDDVNREHLQRLTPQLNGWATNLNNLTLTQVQLDASHKTIMNDEVHIRAVGDAISSFVESLGNDF